MKKTNKGFTIVELVIVIAVIAILAAVLIPTFTNLIREANLSVDEQHVKQMNQALKADEYLNGKPATVVDAIKVLEANGFADVTPNLKENCFYWVGSENQILIWTLDEVPAGSDALDAGMARVAKTAQLGRVVAMGIAVDKEIGNGKVTYPEELAEKYEGVTTPSAEWTLIADKEGSVDIEDIPVIEVAPEEGETVKDALVNAIANAADGTIIKLPANSVLPVNNTDGGFYVISQALAEDSGLGKSITIDMNGSTFTCSGVNSAFMKNPDGSWMMNGSNYVMNILTIPANGELILINGSMDISGFSQSTATIQVESGANLVLRDMEVNTSGAAVFAASDACEVTIENCKIKGGYGVGTNATSSNNVRINVRNCEIDASVPVLMNVPGELVVENCTITGYNQVIIVRGGTAVIKNNKLYNVADDTKESMAGWWNYFMDDNATMSAWSSGNRVPIAAIVIGQDFDKTGPYDHPNDVVMTGNEIHVLENGMGVYIEGDGSGNLAQLTESGNKFFYHDTSAWTGGTELTNVTPAEYNKDMTADEKMIVYTNETGSNVTINGVKVQDGE